MAPPNPAPLSKARYDALLRDIQDLLRSADTAVASHKVRAYWQLGQRLARERIEKGAGYHNAILRDLAADSRIALRTLQRTVAFHAAYPKPPSPDAGLNWFHYLQLVPLPPDLREHYSRLALQKQLSAQRLAALIQAETSQHPEADTLLPRPTAPSYLYKAALHALVDADTLDVIFDLGFHITRGERIRLACLDAPELTTKQGRAARDFVAACLIPAKTLVVQTRKQDLHGRYVGHLFYSVREVSIEACFARGIYLNEQLLTEGLAERV